MNSVSDAHLQIDAHALITFVSQKMEEEKTQIE